MTSGGESERLFEASSIPSAGTAGVSDRLRRLESPVTHRDGQPESRSRSAAIDLLSKRPHGPRRRYPRQLQALWRIDGP